MLDPGQLIQQLRRNRFAAFAGAHLATTIPIPEGLINQIIAATMPQDLPVRAVSVQPEAGNRLSVRVVPRAMFIPAITLKLNIEKQPELPTSPLLVLRLATMPGILGLAGSAFSLDRALPPGITLQGEVLLVDLRTLAAAHGAGDLFDLATAVRVTTAPGRLIVHLEAQVPTGS